MKISFLPKTRLGKRSVILMISSWVVFVVGSVLPWKEGYSGFEIIIQNPIQGILTLLMLVFGLATTSAALFSIIKHKERSFLAYLAVLAGLYSILGFVGSIVTLFFDAT